MIQTIILLVAATLAACKPSEPQAQRAQAVDTTATPAVAPALDATPAAPRSLAQDSVRWNDASCTGPEAVRRGLKYQGDIAVHPAVDPVPRAAEEGRWIVRNYCPGEYCSYGRWRLNKGVTMRRALESSADSVGYVPASYPVHADSGFGLIEPGTVVITAPPPVIDFAQHLPAFAAGDTVFVLAYTSEGYWAVLWRKCLTISLAYWDSVGTEGARLVREPKIQWWMHLTDRSTGVEGWVLMDGVFDIDAGT